MSGAMCLDEMFDQHSQRRVVWQKRGDKLTRKLVDSVADGDVAARRTIVCKDQADAD